MKRSILLTIAIMLAINISAQEINIVGTWQEVDPNQSHNQVLNESIVTKTWIFSADGTKTLKGRQQLTYPIGGINCTFDMIQSRTDGKWTLNGTTLTMEAIPLNKLTIDVDYQKYGNYTAAQKQKINAGIPAFRQQAIKETRQGWQSFVGHISTYTISSYTPMRMILDMNGKKFVLDRDVSKMTAVQKAQFEKEVAEYEARIQKEKEIEAARPKADEKTSLFVLLACVACADGECSKDEGKVLAEYAKKFDIDGNRFTATFEDIEKGNLVFSIPKDNSEKESNIKALIELAKVGGVIAANEIAFIKEVAKKYELSETFVDNMIE